MAEKTFRSPGFFDYEIDLSQPGPTALGTPAGIIGTAQKGPAFVPVTVGSMSDFESKFGKLSPSRFGPYAVKEFLENRSAVTYVRVLGPGVMSSSGDIDGKRVLGTVPNAGFKLEPTAVSDDRGHNGAMQFLAADHYISASETIGMPMFSDNDSFDDAGLGLGARIVRAMIVPSADARIMIMNWNEFYAAAGPANDLAQVGDGALSTVNSAMANCFKLVVSSSAGAVFSNDEGFAGIKIYTASLDPDNNNYLRNVLNTDPEEFSAQKHYLYASFDVDAQLAAASVAVDGVAILSGSSNTNRHSIQWLNSFGKFDTSYTTPTTPMFISQPYGGVEYDLFRIEAISDGEHANTSVKISISNVRASSNPNSPYGIFTLKVRKFGDTDVNPTFVEEYPNVTLDSKASNYIARAIGDKKATYNFDAASQDERRLIITGKYPNISNLIRVVMSDEMVAAEVPNNAIPFGFRGMGLTKTTPNLTDYGLLNAAAQPMLTGSGATNISSSILPPIPLRFKVTSGPLYGATAAERTAGIEWVGQPGQNETVDSRFHWGVKFERNTSPYNANPSEALNQCIPAFAKFLGIEKMDTVITGTQNRDQFNNNKFTLARVALSVSSSTYSLVDSSTTKTLMKSAAYMRNGFVNPAASGSDGAAYMVSDPVSNKARLTMASLLSSGSLKFNRFAAYNKFSTFLAGGWDGVNILDKNARRLDDKAAATTTNGGANSAFVSPGLGSNMAGAGKYNSTIQAYQTAIEMLTNRNSSLINILAVPGIRDPFVTDRASARVKSSYQLAIFIMDLEEYSDSGARMYDDSTTVPSVRKTWEQFDSRAIDNNYTATYFPDVVIETSSGAHVKMPASVAAIAALGYNDQFGYPWFAPAGFNRGALTMVKNVDVRLSK